MRPTYGLLLNAFGGAARMFALGFAGEKTARAAQRTLGLTYTAKANQDLD